MRFLLLFWTNSGKNFVADGFGVLYRLELGVFDLTRDLLTTRSLG